MNSILKLIPIALTVAFYQPLSAQQFVRYSPLLDRNDVTIWEKDTARSFDPNGIILNKGEYHPVGIIQYGMLTLDQFQLTGDSSYYQKTVAQAEYLLGNDFVHPLASNAMAGIPYNFEYKGLKPPWYSGMAQGLAISYLLRFAQVNNDDRITKRVHQFCELMTRPIEQGGCVSRLPEDDIWIEEYPNSRESPHVLNGFLFGLVGLCEYLQVYPNQRFMQIKDELLASLKQVIHVYDVQHWTKYNRAVVYPNRLNYVQLQMWQMKQLHEITGDDLWLRQLCIWSAMAHGKTQDEKNDSWEFEEHWIGIPGTIENMEIRPDPYPFQYSGFEKSRVDQELVDQMPWYGFAASNIFKIEGERKFNVTVDSTNSDVHILYRHHWDPMLFQAVKWKAVNGVSASEYDFDLKPGVAQFGVFYKMENPRSALKIENIGWVE